MSKSMESLRAPVRPRSRNLSTRAVFLTLGLSLAGSGGLVDASPAAAKAADGRATCEAPAPDTTVVKASTGKEAKKIPNGWKKKDIKKVAKAMINNAVSTVGSDGKRYGVNYTEQENGNNGEVTARDTIPAWEAQIERIKAGSSEPVYAIRGSFLLEDGATKELFTVACPLVWGFQVDEASATGYYSESARDTANYNSMIMFYKNPTDGSSEALNIFPGGVGWPTVPGTRLIGVFGPPDDSKIRLTEGKLKFGEDGSYFLDTGAEQLTPQTTELFPTVVAALENTIRNIGEDGIFHQLQEVNTIQR